ncbi:MAG: RNA polymerase sigma factor [Planctomycetota bacterium]
MHARSLQARLAAGEEAAFAELYDTHGAQLFRIATAIVGAGRQADAEDALQDVFTGLVRVRRSLARVDNLAGYLVASVRRAAIRRRRQPRLAALPDADLTPDAPSPAHDGAWSAAGSALLERALAALPDDQREVLALKFEAGLTFADIASALGISPNTAASRYRYALEKLRERMTGSRPGDHHKP